jgi:protocatechuate 3,4-dioxygenase alpha subunit
MTEVREAPAHRAPAAQARGTTPSQTVGPYLSLALPWPDGPDLLAVDAPGGITLVGHVYDGHGAVVTDGMVEVWQADPDGRFAHPDDPRGPASYPGFRGFGRSATDASGAFHFRTLKPGPVPDVDGEQAPHLDLSVFARGLLVRLVTRVYFPGEPGNATDPLLRTLEPDVASALVAEQVEETTYRFDIRLQGDGETPFFEV